MRSRKQQLEMVGQGLKRPSQVFGGSLLNGNNPKCRRPLSSKLPIHLVLRANKSVLRLPKTFAMIEREVAAKAQQNGVRIYRSANVGNHIHLVIRVTKRHLWAKFIRALTGALAKKIRALGLIKDSRLWKYRPYTRVVNGWAHTYRELLAYVDLNDLEALGHIDRKETRTLRDFREIWQT